jgi:hypothetical protein
VSANSHRRQKPKYKPTPSAYQAQQRSTGIILVAMVILLAIFVAVIFYFHERQSLIP